MDALVALAPPEIDVVLGLYEYTIPALPASHWIAAIMSKEGGAILPGLLEYQDRRDVWADFAKGEVTAEELADTAREVVTEAAGRPWWEADRLIRSAFTKQSWPIVSGEMTMRGIDVSAIPLSSWLNWLYVLVVSRCKDDNERAKFEAQLQVIPKGVEPDEVFDEDDAAAAFMAAMGEQNALFGGAPGG